MTRWAPNIMRNWIVVDVEASGASPINGIMTEFGAVHVESKEFIGITIWTSHPDPDNPAVPIPEKRIQSQYEAAIRFNKWLREVCDGSPVFVSDNPAFDFMWIAAMFDRTRIKNPFGHSARRIGDFWAGMHLDWKDTQSWKRLRRTPHDHNPVHDAMGNVEAIEQILELAKEAKNRDHCDH